MANIAGPGERVRGLQRDRADFARMLDARCPYGSDHVLGSDRLTATERMLGLGGTFEYARCTTCGSLTLLNPPADASPYYPSGYYSFDLAADPGVHRVFSPVMGAMLRVPGLSRRAARGRFGGSVFPFAAAWFAGLGVNQGSSILDVGSGAGTTLARLRLMGFRNLTGIDPFLPVQEHLVGPVSIRRQSLADVTDSYDLIVFNHVLEHIEQPIAELALAAQRLNPGGHVIVRVPLADSYACEHYGEFWSQLDAPRHVTLPTQRGLERGVTDAGLRVVDAWRDSNAFQFWGSEQYQLGITKFGERSWEGDREHSPFTEQQVKAWEAESRQLNAAGRGDQGAFALAAI